MKSIFHSKFLSWFILLALVMVWGSSFILMKRGLEVFSSTEVGALRISMTFVFLLPLFIKNFRMSPHTYKWLTNPQNQENSKSLALSALFRFARQAKQEGFKDAIKRLQQALGSNCSEETLDALFPLSAKFELSTNTLMLEDPIQMRMTVVIQRLSNAINQSISPSTLLRKLERFADEIEDED